MSIAFRMAFRVRGRQLWLAFFLAAQAVPAPIQAVQEILKLGVQAGEIAVVAEGVFYTPRQLAAIVEIAMARSEGRPFSAAEFRDWLGTSRKYAIPLLEHFGARRVTMRVADLHALVERDKAR